MVGALPLGDALNKRNITSGMCFFCSAEFQHSGHWFLTCQMVRMVWRCVNKTWICLIGVKTIFIQLGFCTYGEQWSDASFPIYFRILEAYVAMLNGLFLLQLIVLEKLQKRDLKKANRARWFVNIFDIWIDV